MNGQRKEGLWLCILILKLLFALLIVWSALNLVRRGQISAVINIRLGKSSDATVRGFR